MCQTKQILFDSVIYLSNKPQTVNKTNMRNINIHTLRRIVFNLLPCLLMLTAVAKQASAANETDGWTLYPSYSNITEIEPTGKEVYKLYNEYKSNTPYSKAYKTPIRTSTCLKETATSPTCLTYT